MDDDVAQQHSIPPNSPARMSSITISIISLIKVIVHETGRDIYVHRTH
jgi:hypothetical protein